MSHKTIDFADFHEFELPRRLTEGNGALAAVTSKPGRTFAWRLTDGQAATYRISENGVEVLPGDDAEVVVEVSSEDWSMYAQELKSCFALLYTDALKMRAGSFNHFSGWEPTLLAAYFGRPIYDEAPELLDMKDRPLVLETSFTLDDDPAEISHFFQTAGFVHIRNVFSAEEVAKHSAIVDEAMSAAHASDKRSWWATKQDGSQVCCRVTYLNEKYEQVRALRDDARLQQICDFSGEELLPNPDRLDGYSVVVKHGEISEGMSNLPWHRGLRHGRTFGFVPRRKCGDSARPCQQCERTTSFSGGFAPPLQPRPDC